MLTPALIILALLVLGAGVVVWATRRKPESPPTAREGDTAWNDPVTSDEGDTPSREPRP